MMKPCNPEGEGLRKLQQHHYNLWEDRWKLEARGKPVGLVCISCLDLSGLVGRSAKFSVTELREISACLRESWAKAGRTLTPSCQVRM